MINSRQHPVLQQAKACFDRRGRQESGLFVIEGPRALWTAFDAHVQFDVVVAEVSAGYPELRDRLLNGGVKIMPASPGVLSTVCDTVTSQGWLALAHIPQHPDLLLDPPERLLILDGVQDPGNVGTLLRTADAVGAGVILLPGTADPLGPKVVRASAGSVVRVPWTMGEREGLREWLREKRMGVVVLDSGSGEMLHRVELPLPLALVAGSEAHGPSPVWEGLRKVRLAMRPGAESLNVAIAASVAMYESIRQEATGYDGA